MSKILKNIYIWVFLVNSESVVLLAFVKYMLYSHCTKNYIFLYFLETKKPFQFLFQWKLIPGTWLPTSALYLCNKNTALGNRQQFYPCSLPIKIYFFSVLLLSSFRKSSYKQVTQKIFKLTTRMFAFNIQIQ